MKTNLFSILLICAAALSLLAGCAAHVKKLTAGPWTIAYNAQSGGVDIHKNSRLLFNNLYASSQSPDSSNSFNSLTYPHRKITVEPINDLFGKGSLYKIRYSGDKLPELTQSFYLYPDKDYILTDFTLDSPSGVTANYMAPVNIDNMPAVLAGNGSSRALFIPFDNDKWIRYRSHPLDFTKLTSYEVTAVFNNDDRHGLVIGSIEHDNWKSAVRMGKGDAYNIGSLTCYGGAADELTRDSKPHGALQGKTVKSPKVLLGYFDDWRNGLETYADVNALVTPPRTWNKAVPFGWNSWGVLQFNLTYPKAMEVSGFFKDHLQNHSFVNPDGTVYVGLDSGWDRFSEEELKSFTDQCKANGQVPCIYWTPFTDWGKNPERPVKDQPGYKYKDLYLYANGKPQELDGAYALDPTHPAVEAMMKKTSDMFRRTGFEYVKMDFMTHGAMEADKWYRPEITTGIQGYNYGLQLIDRYFNDMYINLSISPVFPAQYAQSRRIACDAWNKIKDTEYTLNATSYGWWQDRIYQFNDADHVVLRDATEGENRARITSAVITGIFITGDDFSAGGPEEGKERAGKYLTNAEVNAIATGEAFRPLEGNGEKSENCFLRTGEDGVCYLAVFNYSDSEQSSAIPLERMGLDAQKPYTVKELWRGTETTVSGTVNITVPAKDVMLLKINIQPLSLRYGQPATEWMHATPAGNGRLGAMIYGGTDTETVALNEITLWSGQPDENQEQACGKEQLAKIRQLFFEGNIPEGNHLGTQYLSGTPHSFGTHLPFGDLKIRFNYPSSGISNYKRELNIENSITTVTYQAGDTHYMQEYFCSNPDNVLVIKLSSDKKDALNFEAGLDLLRRSDITASGNTLSFTGQALFPKQGPGGVLYAGNIRISSKDGKITAKENTLAVENGQEALIIIDLRTNYKNPEYAAVCSQTVEQAASKTYEELKQAHIADYTRLFNRTQLCLGHSDLDTLPTDVRRSRLKTTGQDDPGLMALFFQYGRYLLISSSRENSPLPANLQGVWNDNLACNMGWTCDYHLDINTEQNYWLANTGNLAECNAPLFTYLEDLAHHGEKTAMKVYGSPGWVAHTVANVWGYTAPGQGVSWGLAPSSGAWQASHLWSHYCFTQDKKFLQERAYPVLKKAAVFFLDYLALDPRNGYLMTGPSISPENSFKVDGREWCMSLTPTIDRIMVYETFNSCIESAKILGVDEDFRLSLQAAVAKLPPIQIGKAGTIQEWFEDYDLAHPEHRHASHLLSLYPYSQISLVRTPELAEAASKSIYSRTHAPNYEDTEWSRANDICFYARLKQADNAYDNIKGLLTVFSRENLFTCSPAGVAGAGEDIFSFDANEAAPAGIAEMLVQSHEGYIEFLPALPAQWQNGYFKGLCVRGGAEVDLTWEKGAVKYARLTASAGNTFSVKLPGTGGITTFDLKKGEQKEWKW